MGYNVECMYTCRVEHLPFSWSTIYLKATKNQKVFSFLSYLHKMTVKTVPLFFLYFLWRWDEIENTFEDFATFNDKRDFAKVRIFWEGHKIQKNLPLKVWRYWVTSNFKWKIFSNFVAFSEYPNFNLVRFHNFKSRWHLNFQKAKEYTGILSSYKIKYKTER